MNYTHEIEKMCTVAKGCDHGPAPIPEEGRWVKVWAGVLPSRAPAN